MEMWLTGEVRFPCKQENLSLSPQYLHQKHAPVTQDGGAEAGQSMMSAL